MTKSLPSVVAAFIACVALAPSALFAWNSSKVQYDTNGRLTYPADTAGNRIPDFSNAGYKGGGTKNQEQKGLADALIAAGVIDASLGGTTS